MMTVKRPAAAIIFDDNTGKDKGKASMDDNCFISSSIRRASGRIQSNILVGMVVVAVMMVQVGDNDERVVRRVRFLFGGYGKRTERDDFESCVFQKDQARLGTQSPNFFAHDK
jgi:hypothetical protein